MRERISKQSIFIVISLLITGSSIVLGISYYALSKIAFSGDRIYYGKKQSVLAGQIREELLRRKNVTAVQFSSNDGMKLAGIMITRTQAKANLILCHGFKGGKEFLYSFVDMFPNWNILLFDFRAHGQSEGNITAIGCHEYLDVIAAAHFLKNEIKLSIPTILLGVSMGGASALKAVKVDPSICDLLIIDSTYANLNKILYNTFSNRSGLPQFPFFPIVKSLFQYFAQCDVEKMDPSKGISEIKQPIFIIHSCNDSLISPNNAIKLFANTLNKKSKLWIAPHCRHAWLHVYQSDQYKKKIVSFVQNNQVIKEKEAWV